MALDDSIQNLVGVGEHSIGEKEGGSVVRAGRVRDEQREERGNGVDLVPWSIREEEEDRGFNITTLHYVSAISVFVYAMCVGGGGRRGIPCHRVCVFAYFAFMCLNLLINTHQIT